jgi:hypothetical protein
MDYFAEKEKLSRDFQTKLKAHDEKYFCNHESSGIAKRIVGGGGIQYVVQYAKCGQPISGAIARKTVLEKLGGKEPPEFDNELYDSWNSSKSTECQALYQKYQDDKTRLAKAFGIEDKSDKEGFFEVYNEHLKSEKWNQKRDKVFKRAKGTCEGCLENKATIVHHLTYANVGDELLFQLVALCDECHSKCHNHI